MRKVTSKRRKLPTPASLRELPEVDFTRYRAVRNRYAAKVARTGVVVVHDEPSADSLDEIPEADVESSRVRRNPYASRAAEAIARMKYGKGRPKRGREVGSTPTRSIRLPQVVWDALEAEAKRTGTTVHALLRKAVGAWLTRDPK